MDTSEITAWVAAIVGVGTGIATIIRTWYKSRAKSEASSVDSCLKLVDELAERVDKLEAANKELQDELIDVLSKRRDEDRINIEAIANLKAKVEILNSENVTLRDRINHLEANINGGRSTKNTPQES